MNLLFYLLLCFHCHIVFNGHKEMWHGSHNTFYTNGIMKVQRNNVVLIIFSVFNVVTNYKLLMRTKVGLIRGLRGKDGDYFMFLGVPYAMVNKTNPFGESLPYPHFKTVFNAHDDTASCPQEDEFKTVIVGDLDCLHLNIYVPNSANRTHKLPVLTYIHGGNLRIGYGGRYLYGPKYLVRHGIIFVTLNYRLGPYGYFCTDTPEAAGNEGFKDQIKALKWIRDNIGAFGGDPEKITVCGHSSGASSVELILHSLNGDEKLFDKVIIQSPYQYCVEIDHSASYDKAPFQIANHLGFKTDSVRDALSYISSLDSTSVIAASLNLSTPYAYCIEKSTDEDKKFLNDYVVNLNVPAVRNMPILYGNTDREALFMYAKEKPEYFDDCNVFEEFLSNFDFNEEHFKKMADIIRRYYIGDQKIDERGKKEIIMFTSDYRYYHAAKRSMFKYIDNGASNVFYYIFSYDGGRNFLKFVQNITDRGATHADELGYQYDMSFMDKNPSSKDLLTIDRLTTLWANFVKYGDPTPKTTPLLPVKWTPYTKHNQRYLNIDSELSLGSQFLHSRMAFWDLFYEMNREMQRGYRRSNNTYV